MISLSWGYLLISEAILAYLYIQYLYIVKYDRSSKVSISVRRFQSLFSHNAFRAAEDCRTNSLQVPAECTLRSFHRIFREGFRQTQRVILLVKATSILGGSGHHQHRET